NQQSDRAFRRTGRLPELDELFPIADSVEPRAHRRRPSVRPVVQREQRAKEKRGQTGAGTPLVLNDLCSDAPSVIHEWPVSTFHTRCEQGSALSDLLEENDDQEDAL